MLETSEREGELHMSLAAFDHDQAQCHARYRTVCKLLATVTEMRRQELASLERVLSGAGACLISKPS